MKLFDGHVNVISGFITDRYMSTGFTEVLASTSANPVDVNYSMTQPIKRTLSMLQPSI